MHYFDSISYHITNRAHRRIVASKLLTSPAPSLLRPLPLPRTTDGTTVTGRKSIHYMKNAVMTGTRRIARHVPMSMPNTKTIQRHIPMPKVKV